jgi:hypothetical protein
MVMVPCERCGREFEATVRDRERGWARFCGKSCSMRTRRAAGGGLMPAIVEGVPLNAAQ